MENYSALSEILLRALDDQSLRQSLQTDLDSAVRTMQLDEKLSVEELAQLRMVFCEGIPGPEETETYECSYRGYN
jgi:hypothetical protein